MNNRLAILKKDSTNRNIQNHPLDYLRVPVLVVGLLLFSTSPLLGQLSGLTTGDRVRLYAPSVDQSKLVGTVSELSSSAMVLAADDSSYTIPYTSIEQLALNTGKESKILRGALLGLAVGGLSGGVIGAGTYREKGCEAKKCILEGFGVIEAMFKGYLIGSASGLILGAILGSKKRDRWQSMPVQLSMSPVLNRSQQISMNPTVTFRMSLSGGNR